jgi:hypothetical protein
MTSSTTYHGVDAQFLCSKIVAQVIVSPSFPYVSPVSISSFFGRRLCWIQEGAYCRSAQICRTLDVRDSPVCRVRKGTQGGEFGVRSSTPVEGCARATAYAYVVRCARRWYEHSAMTRRLFGAGARVLLRTFTYELVQS